MSTSVIVLALLAAGAASGPDLPIAGLANVGIRVADLEKARSFYSGLLGFDAALDQRDEAGATTAVHFKINEEQYLVIYPGLRPNDDIRRVHVALATPDANGLHALLGERRLSPGPIVKSAEGNLEFSLRAPEGTPLKFLQYLPESPQVRARGRFLGPNRISTRLLHAAVVVSNLDASLGFYRDGLGLREFWRGGPTEGELRWIMLRVPGDRRDYIEFMLFRNPLNRQQSGAACHVSLEVANVRAAHKQLLARGMPDDKRRQPLVGRDRHWLLNLLDPDGTRIELMETRTVETSND